MSVNSRPRLLGHYPPKRHGDTRRAPWTWSTVHPQDQAEFTSHIDEWVDFYNLTYTTEPNDVIPICWPQHPWLAMELAVQTWQWFSAHIDPTANAERAGEYYLRYLPGFKQRLDLMLGRSPTECRTGQHLSTWRSETDELVASNICPGPPDRSAEFAAICQRHFGFPNNQSPL